MKIAKIDNVRKKILLNEASRFDPNDCFLQPYRLENKKIFSTNLSDFVVKVTSNALDFTTISKLCEEVC